MSNVDAVVPFLFQFHHRLLLTILIIMVCSLSLDGAVAFQHMIQKQNYYGRLLPHPHAFGRAMTSWVTQSTTAVGNRPFVGQGRTTMAPTTTWMRTTRNTNMGLERRAQTSFRKATALSSSSSTSFLRNHTTGSTRPMHTTQERNTKDAAVVLDPLVVCGPSGVGKGTIIQRFLQEQDETPTTPSFGFSVSHTTRKPRPGEVHGVQYHFLSVSEMEHLLFGSSSSTDEASTQREETDTTGYFLEWAKVHGNYYGTSWQAILQVQAMGQKCLLDIDVQGVKRLHALREQQQQENDGILTIPSSSSSTNDDDDNEDKILLQPKFIFIAPPSMQVLEARLRNRGTEEEAQVRQRLQNAAAELDYGLNTNNPEDNKWDAVIINHDLDTAVNEFQTHVQRLYQTETDKSS